MSQKIPSYFKFELGGLPIIMDGIPMNQLTEIVKEMTSLNESLKLVRKRLSWLNARPDYTLIINSRNTYGNEDVLILASTDDGHKTLYNCIKTTLEAREQELIKQITDKARELIPEEQSVG